MSAVRRVLRSSSAPCLFTGSFRSLGSSPTSTFTRLSRRKVPLRVSRLPVELGCAQSLMPLHSITASALLNSMLSPKCGSWAWLSEGFATPL